MHGNFTVGLQGFCAPSLYNPRPVLQWVYNEHCKIIVKVTMSLQCYTVNVQWEEGSHIVNLQSFYKVDDGE